MERNREELEAFRETIPDPKGAHSFLERGEYLASVAEKYGRDPSGLCLKVCYICPLKPNESFETWKDDHHFPIMNFTKLQNICYWRGISPRVYAVDVIDYKGYKLGAQLQDFVLGEQEGSNKPLYEEVCNIVEEYGGIIRYLGDIPWNSVAGKWIDFGGFGLPDKEVYKRKVLETIETSLKYQIVPGIFTGGRSTEERVKDLRLDEIDFRGKTVLDIGCAQGMFCNYASKRGAKRIVGIDTAQQTHAAREISNYFEQFNVDFIEANLLGMKYDTFCQLSDIHKFDIVFFFSASAYLDSPEFIHKAVGDLMVFERSSGPQADGDEAGVAELLSHFSVEQRPNSKDKNREVYWCKTFGP